MKQWTLSIILAAATAVVVSAQTTSTYRGMTVRVPAPTGAAGLAWQNNFKSLADRIGNHIEAVTDPTANDDEANTAGHGAVMDRSTWRNTEDNGFFVCVDASEGAAVWLELGEAVDLSAPGPIGDMTPSSGVFTALAVGTATPSYSLDIETDDDTTAIRLSRNSGADLAQGSDTLDVDFRFFETDGNDNIVARIRSLLDSNEVEGNLLFQTATNGEVSLRTQMLINCDGNVGINENSPDYKLEVNGDIGCTGGIAIPADNQSLTLGLADDFDISYDGSKGVIDCAGGVYLTQSPLDVLGGIQWRNTLGNLIGFFTQASSGGRMLLSNSGGATMIDMKAAGPSYMHTSLGINESAPDYALDVNGSFGCTPASSVTPVDNGDLVIEATSNTSLTFRYKGSDGTVRSASLTLSP